MPEQIERYFIGQRFRELKGGVQLQLVGMITRRQAMSDGGQVSLE